MEQSLIFIIIGIIVFIVIFLLLREFWCWYWKVNKIITLLEKIEQNTSINQNNSIQAESNDLNKKWSI